MYVPASTLAYPYKHIVISVLDIDMAETNTQTP